MFCLFFTSGPIVDLAGAQQSDLKMFAGFFHACLKRGIYFAPSQFETGFISTAHTPEDINRTTALVRDAVDGVVDRNVPATRRSTAISGCGAGGHPVCRESSQSPGEAPSCPTGKMPVLRRAPNFSAIPTV